MTLLGRQQTPGTVARALLYHHPVTYAERVAFWGGSMTKIRSQGSNYFAWLSPVWGTSVELDLE